MKLAKLLLIFASMQFAVLNAFSQCTPVDCLGSLPAYGGICQTALDTGRINEPYSDDISFHITNVCIDAGEFDPQYAGTGAKLLKLHSFSFSGFPAGLTGATNQSEYDASANTNGCGAVSGTPTEVGVFDATIHIFANINTYIGSITCNSFIQIPINNQPFDGSLSLVILPDPSFTGLNGPYCEADPAVTLTPTGTPGGIFSGPGVDGNTFNPLLAGAGTHTITYTVSAQQGSATAPATDSKSLSVTVIAANTYYADNDGDNFGNPDSVIFACVQPAGYIPDSLDCNDTSALVNPNTVWYADNDEDNYFSVTDSAIGCIPPTAYYTIPALALGPDCDDDNQEIGTPLVFYMDSDNDLFGNPDSTISECSQPVGYVSNNTDCNDTNAAINPDAIDIPDNGIDEDCSGYDSSITGINKTLNTSFLIYPNPVSDFTFIIQNNNIAMAGDYFVHVENCFGQIILRQALTEQYNKIVMPHTSSRGIYFVIIRDISNKTCLVKKIVVQ
ncbi:MAG: MopE-related protein [Bacteroidales bacterium]|jgi:hypothetical protein|nr:MopE-related protein [Bacteroidales bacterium]MDD4215358.1 MopE-related protein [Bacteroidales bacterium]